MIRRIVLPRLLQLFGLFLLVAILGFLMLHATPGDPARVLAGPAATPAQVATERGLLGLDHPLLVQLASWIGHVVTGHLGTSYSYHQPVAQVLAQAAPPTIQLTVFAMVFTLLLGIPLGVVSGVRAGGLVDAAGRIYALAGVAIPGFVVGLLLVLVFGYFWPNVLPYTGYVSFFSDPWNAVLHTVLPAICLAIGPIAIVTRQTRSTIIEVLGAEYITAARALGVPERKIIWIDAMKPALIPVLTIFGLLVGLVLSATVVIENVFNIPGLGRELVTAFDNEDYPMAIGVMLFYAAWILVVNLLTDLAYAAVNPRIRRAYSS